MVGFCNALSTCTFFVLTSGLRDPHYPPRAKFVRAFPEEIYLTIFPQGLTASKRVARIIADL